MTIRGQSNVHADVLAGMKDEHIEKLYRGLHAQAVMFQQLVDQQANGRPGEDAKLMGQLLEGFHGLSRRARLRPPCTRPDCKRGCLCSN